MVRLFPYGTTLSQSAIDPVATIRKLQLKEYPQLAYSSRILSNTVSREADLWFVA